MKTFSVKIGVAFLGALALGASSLAGADEGSSASEAESKALSTDGPPLVSVPAEDSMFKPDAACTSSAAKTAWRRGTEQALSGLRFRAKVHYRVGKNTRQCSEYRDTAEEGCCKRAYAKAETPLKQALLKRARGEPAPEFPSTPDGEKCLASFNIGSSEAITDCDSNACRFWVRDRRNEGQMLGCMMLGYTAQHNASCPSERGPASEATIDPLLTPEAASFFRSAKHLRDLDSAHKPGNSSAGGTEDLGGSI